MKKTRKQEPTPANPKELLRELTSDQLIKELERRFPAMLFAGLRQIDGNKMDTVYSEKGPPEIQIALFAGMEGRVSGHCKTSKIQRPEEDDEDGGNTERVGSFNL